jgi:hypothetical protein
MKIKVFTKVGIMRGEKWIKGVLLEEHDNIFVVETYGNKISIEKRFVKPILELEHNNGKYPELEEFAKNNWEELKEIILDSMKHFFSFVNVKINDEEKIIECEDCGISIACSIKEVETISCFKEIPVWEVVVGHSIPATRNEPEDYAESVISAESSSLITAKFFIDSIWKFYSSLYWEKYSCH